MALTEHNKFISKAIVRFTIMLLLLHNFVLGLDPAEEVKHFGRTVWQTEKGLPQNTVHSIKQSRDGFIWIATEEGLARFDGINFLVFNKQNTPQIKSNDIRSVSEDRQGGLW